VTQEHKRCATVSLVSSPTFLILSSKHTTAWFDNNGISPPPTVEIEHDEGNHDRLKDSKLRPVR
jgi:hypothetical protein